MKSGISKYKKNQKTVDKSKKKGLLDPEILHDELVKMDSDDEAEDQVYISQAAAEKLATEAMIEDVEFQITETEKTFEKITLEKPVIEKPKVIKEAMGSREEIIKEYAPLTKFIAQKIAARLPASIQLDDLISSGIIGLMDAIEKYDPSRDNKFKTYAEFRIRGAILDELRSQDWVPRSVREKAKTLERVYARIEQAKGRPANDDDICKELNISKEEYHELLNEVRSVSLLSYDDLSSVSKGDRRYNEFSDQMRTQNPFSEMNSIHVKKLVAEAINDLPEKQRLVLSLYYYEDLNLKEIGKVLDVTESRVSQLHTQAILKLKARLKGHFDELQSMFV